MTTELLDIEYYRGDTFPSLVFAPAFKDDAGDPVNPPGTATAALMQFRQHKASGDVLATWSSSSETIAITDAAEWIFTTDPQILTTTFSGRAVYDFQVTYTDSVDGLTKIKTIESGYLPVFADVSRA
jgi:hypothetical protein